MLPQPLYAIETHSCNSHYIVTRKIIILLSKHLIIIM